jgi:general secretion pathway protein A
MYIAHFGLNAPPFAITPDPRFLYMSDRHREGLAHLLYGIRQPGGFVQLTGEVGTGKTTLCRCLLEQLPPEVDVALVLNPQVTPAEFLATLCDELGISYPTGSQSIKPFVDALHRYLLEAHARGRRTVLIIDEAQNLPPDVLEQIRLLTNLETATEKLLQIILIGQPELIRVLERPQLRQLAQRITARYHLQPFSFRDTAAYVSHRLRVGGRGDRLFTSAALHEIHLWSGGIPRLINVVCDRSLLGGYTRDARRIDAGMVRRAAREVRGERLRSGLRARLALAAAVALLAGAVAAGGYLAATRGWLPEIPSLWEAAIPAPTVAATDRPPDVATAAPLAPAEPPVPSSRLSALLADAARRTDQGVAFAGLFARWGVDARKLAPAPGGPCEAAGPTGLWCTPMAGNWGRIRRLDVPVLLRMTTTDGARLYVPLVALGPADATLEIDGKQQTFPLREIEGFWDGPFLVAWKFPIPGRRLLAPGARGADVAWVRSRLAAAERSDPGADPSDVFDEKLAERVRGFQRAHTLAADGVVGEETLLHLSLATREPNTPALSEPRP